MPPLDEFTAEELDRLTPAERAAVTADDDTSDMQAIIDDAGDDGEGGEAAAAAAAKGGDQSNDDPAGILSGDDDTPVSPFQAEPVENYEEKIAAAQTKDSEAFKKMMDGDLSADEYQAIKQEAEKEIRELDAKHNQYLTAQSVTKQAAERSWLEYVGNTLATAKANGADMMTDEAIASELNRTVKLLAKQAQEDPTMLKGVPATKPGALITNADKWILNEAMQIVAARRGMTLTKAKPKADADAGAPTNKTRQPDLSGVPPSLSRVPVSADANTGGDEFAYIHKLTGAAHEKAIARLTPEEAERFMA